MARLRSIYTQKCKAGKGGSAGVKEIERNIGLGHVTIENNNNVFKKTQEAVLVWECCYRDQRGDEIKTRMSSLIIHS